MASPFDTLKGVTRLLMQAQLRPCQPHPIQVTNFPDLGPARFQTFREGQDGRDGNWINAVMVDSHQAIANHLEMATWDLAADDWIEPLRGPVGLPYVRIDCGRLGKTHTVREPHRLNSAYIWTGQDTPDTRAFLRAFREAIGFPPDELKPKKRKGDGEAAEGDAEVPGLLDLRRFYKAVFKWDPNSVLHGVFLEKLAGRLRMTRVLSGFIDAYDFKEDAPSGGSKHDPVLPSGKPVGLGTEDGVGNVIYHRTEFAPRTITAYFKLELAQLRGYGLPVAAEELLLALGMLKVRRLLQDGFHPRSNCDLVMVGEDITVTDAKGKPIRLDSRDPASKEFSIPTVDDLIEILKARITACREAELLASPAVTELTWSVPAKKEPGTINLPKGTTHPDLPDDLQEAVEQKSEGSGRTVKTVLVIKVALDDDQVGRLKEAYGNKDKVNKDIDKALAAVRKNTPAPADDQDEEEPEAGV